MKKFWNNLTTTGKILFPLALLLEVVFFIVRPRILKVDRHFGEYLIKYGGAKYEGIAYEK